MNKKQYSFECNVYSSLKDRNDKKYIEFELDPDDSSKIFELHKNTKNLLKNQKIMNPLEGNIIEVKVPFRYNRIMCKVFGKKTIQELIKEDRVEIEIEFGGVWNVGQWSGFSWKLNQLNLTTREVFQTQ